MPVSQSVSFIYGTTPAGTSSSNIKFEEIDKLAELKLR